MLSHETASKQLLDMGLPAFSSMAGKQQTTMQSSLTNGPHKSSKTAIGAQPQHQEQADPYLTRLLQPPPRRQVWSAQPRSAWRAPQPTQSKPAPKVVSSQHAPGPPSALPPTPPITTTTNPRAIKDALGVDVYLHFREVLLRQQETLTHQVRSQEQPLHCRFGFLPPTHHQHSCGSCTDSHNCSATWCL